MSFQKFRSQQTKSKNKTGFFRVILSNNGATIFLFSILLSAIIAISVYGFNLLSKDYPKSNLNRIYDFLVFENSFYLYKNPYLLHDFELITIGYDISDVQSILKCGLNFINMQNQAVPACSKVIHITENSNDSTDAYGNKNSDKSEDGTISEITINPKSNNGYLFYEDVLIKNHTKYSVNTTDLMNEPLKFCFSGTNQGPEVLVIHTHSSESYKSKEDNIMKVGEKIVETLSSMNVNAIHDKTVHDRDFSNSYYASLETINKYLNKYPSIKMVLDVHRDSIVNKQGIAYKPTTLIDNQKVAQLMIVTGTNAGGLFHDNWKENLKFAMKWQEIMKNDYKTLARPIDLREERFNTHTTLASLVLEVGSSASTIEEAINAGIYAGKSLGKLIDILRA